MRKVFSLLTKGDKILFALLLIISFSCIGATVMGKSPVPMIQGEKYLVVEINGRIAKEISLTNEAQIIEVSLDRGIVYLEVKDGRVRVLPMDDDVCPLKVCSRRGWIQGPGEVIVCVPNRMVVYMKAERSIATREEDNASVDAVAF
jgi:hypothetical protein